MLRARSTLPLRLFVQPHLPAHSQTRHYDKNAYQASKRLLKSRSSSLPDFLAALDIVRPFALGAPQTLHLYVLLDSNDRLKGEILLPKVVKARDLSNLILVLADGDAADQARLLGLKHVGGLELIEKLPTMSLDPFLQVLTTPTLFPQILKHAKILGPLNLMPSPKKGTVGTDVKAMLERVSRMIKVNPDAATPSTSSPSSPSSSPSSPSSPPSSSSKPAPIKFQFASLTWTPDEILASHNAVMEFFATNRKKVKSVRLGMDAGPCIGVKVSEVEEKAK